MAGNLSADHDHHDLKQEDLKFSNTARSDKSDDLAALAELQGYYESRAGRVVIDPAEAEREFGPEAARKLKLNKAGDTILWPQPSDSPDDPQNWSDKKKRLMLIIITAAAVVPDFDSGIGIASLFPLAKEFNTTVNHVNNLTTDRYGRLPVLFWSQLVGLAFLIGCAVSDNLTTFAAMRCLNSFFSTAPQIMGLYVVTDMYPFHLQARMLNFWIMGAIISPFLSPWLFGYLVAKESWRLAYGIGCIYQGLIVIFIALFMEETIFNRHIHPDPARPTRGLRYRIETLIGITGIEMAKYRVSWPEAIFSSFNVFWRPQMLLVFLYIMFVFGFGIGINVTNVVFVSEPPPIGYGWPANAVATSYLTPVVAVIIGELLGRYLNDGIANRATKRNKGVFEAEVRLWTLWIGLPLFVAGFVLLGASFQNKLPTVALVFGWGMAEIAIMLSTVSCISYCSACFPQHPGEISALLNQARVLGGFAVPYFQLPWAVKHGALQTFGCEAAIVAGLFFLIVPLLQWKGKSFRDKYSMPLRKAGQKHI